MKIRISWINSIDDTKTSVDGDIDYTGDDQLDLDNVYQTTAEKYEDKGISMDRVDDNQFDSEWFEIELSDAEAANPKVSDVAKAIIEDMEDTMDSLLENYS